MKIDFVPNDYIENRQSSKANFLYLVLFLALMGAIAATFSIIKVRQKAVDSELAEVRQRMANAQTQIAQLEELQEKRKAMMKTALMTAELLEPVPRSVLLACFTNNMPSGVSLLKLKLIENELKSVVSSPNAKSTAKKSQYGAASAAAAGADDKPVLARESKKFETQIEIEGIAPSDIEVAGYIARLGNSIVLDTVSLVESKEHEIDGVKFREFKLKTKLKQGLELSKEDVEKVRIKRESSI